MPSLIRWTAAAACIAATCYFALPISAGKDKFDEMDSNGDKKLSRAEYDGPGRAFNKADVDKDNFLTRAEWATIPAPAGEDPGIPVAKRQLFTLSGALRTHLLRHDEYPAALAGLVDKGIVKEIPKDPWGNEYRYSLVPKKDPAALATRRGVVVVRPAGNAPAPAAVPAKKDPLTFEILSAGPDKIFGTPDDVKKTEESLRLSITPAQREVIIENAGEEYTASQAAWTWEQAFRIWLAVAEKEFATGETVKQLEELELPDTVFPGGKAVDDTNRPYELRAVRGLRAICAQARTGETKEFSLGEAEFATVLQARLKNGGDDYRLNQVHNEVRRYFMSKGRLPLTMTELVANARNAWFARSRTGRTMSYVTINGDKGYVVFDLGMNGAAGGMDEDADMVSYGPHDVTDGTAASANWGATEAATKRFDKLREALVAAKKRDDEKNGKKPDVGGEGSMPVPPAEDGTAQFPEEIRKAMEELRKKQEEVRKATEEADKAKEEATKHLEELKKQAAATPPAPEKTGAAPVEKPAEKPADKPAEKPVEVPAEKPAETPPSKTASAAVNTDDSLVSVANFSTDALKSLTAQIAPVPAPPAPVVPPPMPDPTPTVTATGPDDPTQPKPADPAATPAPKPAPKIILNSRDLVPLLVYSENEAREMSLISDDDWRWQSINNQAENLLTSAVSYLSRAGTATLPCGNVSLDNAKAFREATHFNPDTDRNYGDEQLKPIFIITRFEKGELGKCKSLVVIALPQAKSEDPILIYSMTGDVRSGPFFAAVADQPDGWRDEAEKCDGWPESASNVKIDPPANGANSGSTPGATPGSTPSGAPTGNDAPAAKSESKAESKSDAPAEKTAEKTAATPIKPRNTVRPVPRAAKTESVKTDSAPAKTESAKTE